MSRFLKNLQKSYINLELTYKSPDGGGGGGGGGGDDFDGDDVPIGVGDGRRDEDSGEYLSSSSSSVRYNYVGTNLLCVYIILPACPMQDNYSSMCECVCRWWWGGGRGWE